MDFSFLAKLIGPIMTILTPTLREALEDLLQDWYESAKATESPLDDIAAKAVIEMLGFEAE